MKVNTKMRYGLRAMIEIAKHTPSGGVLQKDISKHQSISFKYLDHILNALKVAQLIRKKSVKEGFILTKEPSQISVYDIYTAFEPQLLIIDCLETEYSCCMQDSCDVKGFWCELNQNIARQMKEVTLKDLSGKT